MIPQNITQIIDYYHGEINAIRVQLFRKQQQHDGERAVSQFDFRDQDFSGD